MSSIFQKPPHSYVYQVGIANLVDYNPNAAVRSGPVTNALLHRLTLPPQTLVQNGQKAIFTAVGNITAHPGNTITFRALGFGTTIFTATDVARATATGFVFITEVWRKTSIFGILSSRLYFSLSDAGAAALAVSVMGAERDAALNNEVEQFIEYDVTTAGAETTQMLSSHCIVQ